MRDKKDTIYRKGRRVDKNIELVGTPMSYRPDKVKRMMIVLDDVRFPISIYQGKVYGAAEDVFYILKYRSIEWVSGWVAAQNGSLRNLRPGETVSMSGTYLVLTDDSTIAGKYDHVKLVKKSVEEMPEDKVEHILTIMGHMIEAHSRKVGLTKREICIICGKDPMYIDRMIQGRLKNFPNFNTLVRFAYACDLEFTMKSTLPRVVDIKGMYKRSKFKQHITIRNTYIDGFI